MNYIGSKKSLLDFLELSIDSIVPNVSGAVFADFFAGTGIVGEAYKKKGCRIISNDIQYYSYVLNRHVIGNRPPLNDEKIDYFNSLEECKDGFLYNNFCRGSGSGRNYFTDENGRKCDAIRIEIERLYKLKEIGEDEYFSYLASLIDSVDKVANTASVYGAYLKHVKKSAEKSLNLERIPIVDGDEGNCVYNEDVQNLVQKVSGDILYLDPPYNARQYSSNYHVLETISRYDNPILTGVTGLRTKDENKSVYCSKRTVVKAFENLIDNARFKYVFLSYNNEGLMDFETIQGIMEKHGKYDVFSQDYRRFKADKSEKRNHKANRTTEYLHVLTR